MKKLLHHFSISTFSSRSRNLRRVAFFSSMMYLVGVVPLWASYDEKEKEAEDVEQISRPASCLQNIGEPTELEILQEKIRALEAQKNFLEAAQEMDHLLEIIPSPAVKDLCYALELNQKASIQKQPRNQVQQLADQISKLLNIDLKATHITFETAFWNQIGPYLDYLIRETIKDPAYENRKFSYKVLGGDFPDYIKWCRDHMASQKYPIDISSRNKGYEGEKSEEGFAKTYFMELHITNNTQKESAARELFAYHFHGGVLDESRVNPLTFYNLMVRAGFSEEDFAEGKYGYQDKILVKPITLQESRISSCFEELKETITLELKKAEHPYVALVFDLPSQISFTITDLTGYDNHSLHRAFFSQVGEPSATIYEYEEKRIYYCFYNEKRKMLDLHGMSYEEAYERTVEFIQERYDDFDSECVIITGQGNHINSNGSRGILHDNFKKWAKGSELKPLIRNHRPYGQGGYKVVLNEPQKLVLDGHSQEQHIKWIIRSILETDKADQNRLIITHQHAQSSTFFDTLLVKSVVQLFCQSQFPGTLQPKTVENALHLTWFHEQEEDYFGTDENEEIALPSSRAAKVTISSSPKRVTSNKQKPLNDKDSQKPRGNNRKPKQQKSLNDNNFQKDIRTPEDYGFCKAAAVNGNIQAYKALRRYHSARGENKAANKYYKKASMLKKEKMILSSLQVAKNKSLSSPKRKPQNTTMIPTPPVLSPPKLPTLKAPVVPPKSNKGSFTSAKSSTAQPEGTIKSSRPKPALEVEIPPVPSKPSKTSKMWRAKKAPEKNEKK